MRRARENLRNDSNAHEEEKKRERERYHKRKQDGKIKTVDKMSSREKRGIQKEECRKNAKIQSRSKKKGRK